jgi:hypothetical protein
MLQKFKLALFMLTVSLFGVAGNAAAVIDTASVTSAISEGQAAGIVVALAFGVAVWAIRGVKMIRRG